MTAPTDTEGVHPIANTANADRIADIVFVHGLGGGSHGTWRYGKEGQPNHFFWPEELAKELPDCGVWTVGYAAGFTELGNPGMIIEKRGRNIANQLALNNVGSRPVIFICHSMGGLVVKALITTSLLTEDANHKRLVSQIRGLVFCCTPHRGSALATAASVIAQVLGGTQDHVKQMHGHSEQLDLLHSEFLAWHRDHPIPVEGFAESVGLFRKGLLGRLVPLGKAVERDSANPSIGTLHDVDGDHLQVVKPSPAVPAIHTPVHLGVLRFVNSVLGSLRPVAHSVESTSETSPSPQSHPASTPVGKPVGTLTRKVLPKEAKLIDVPTVQAPYAMPRPTRRVADDEGGTLGGLGNSVLSTNSSANMKRTLTWLHLSDLHARLRDEWDSAAIIQTLTDDLRQLQQKKGLRPDFIFFTGDAAFSAQAAEYALAGKFFDAVRKAFTPEVEVRNFYIVPGNHDVNRQEVTSDMTDWLRNAKREFVKDILPPLRDNTKQWQKWMERLASYREFIGSYCPHLAPADSHLIWADTQHIHGVPIGICGLNTAWSCVDDEDNGRLWFGTDWQIAQVQKRFTTAPAITFALLHHPGNCFNALEAPTAMRRLQQEFHFVLHGHEHLQWPEPKVDGGIVVSAGACYQSSWLSNGYSFGQIDLDTGARKLFLRRWDDKGRGWVEDNIAKKTKGGVYTLGKAKWAKCPTPESSAKKRELSTATTGGTDTPDVTTNNLDVFRPILETFTRILSEAPNLTKLINDDRSLGTSGSAPEVASALVRYFTDQPFNEAVIRLEGTYLKTAGTDRAAFEAIFDCLFYLALAPDLAARMADTASGVIPIPQHAPHGVLRMLQNWLNKNLAHPVREWSGERLPELSGAETPQQKVAKLTELMKEIRGLTDKPDSALEARIATENLRNQRKTIVIDKMDPALQKELDQSALRFAAILVRQEGLTINPAQLAKLKQAGFQGDFEAFVEESIQFVKELITKPTP